MPVTTSEQRPLTDSSLDRDLYAAAIAGDQSAIRILVQRYQGQLLAWGVANGWARADCDDAVQLAWMRFFQHLQLAAENPDRALRKPESMRYWLVTTTRNALVQEYRSAERRKALVERLSRESLIEVPDYTETLERDQRGAMLRAAFAQLTEACRELLSLLLIDPPLSYDEISETLGRPKGSIGPTRQRCIEQLRTRLEGGNHAR